MYEEVEEFGEEITPARVSVLPGNIGSGGGEVMSLRTLIRIWAPTLDLLDVHEKDVASLMRKS